MTTQIIDNILLFMQRTDLKGNEVPAYAEAFNTLKDLQSEIKNKISSGDTKE